jgi:predicted outer membrane repeat protein
MKTNSNKTTIKNSLHVILTLIWLVGMFGFLPTGSIYALNSTIYVKADASGENDGSSWTDAYTSLQAALTAAVSSDQIWVAEGIYYPTPGTDRTASFTLKNGVSIYGGFDGTEAQLADRDPASNITILSGDIGTSDDISDNSYHVVDGGGTDNTAVLDGFTVEQGNADLIVSGSTDQYGGGMYNAGSSPTLNNLIFTKNTARYGGGMFNTTASSPKLTNVTFLENSAERAGGMYNTISSSPELENVTFSKNSAAGRGGGMTTAQGSEPTLTNVTFNENTAVWGAGLHILDGDPTLINVTFSGNEAEEDGGGIYFESSLEAKLTNVTISGNSAGINGGGIYNENSNPVITNSILYNNTGGEIHNQGSTPVVTYSIVEGGYIGTGNFDNDPLLGPLQDNGGFTQTMALGLTSPAIDAGTNINCPPTDQRGVSRPQDAGCDIGAYELDTTPPETTIDSHPSDPDYDDTPSFTFSGNDGTGSGIKAFMCQMDGSGYSPCTSPFTSSTLLTGMHTFDVYAIDYDSNADETPASYTWTLEFPPTTVSSIVRADASPTSAASVDFTVTFSADVTGVDTGDFTLTTTGVKGSSIANVSGSGDTYTVSVNTGTANGTVRLDVLDDDSIIDGNSNPLGGVGTGNGDFTSGEAYTIDKGGDTVGVFRPSNGVIFLKNTNTSGFADVALNYGLAGDYPVTGDWDGNGTVTIGVYRSGRFLLRNSNTVGFAEINFLFGQAGDQPIAGDWNGDGVDTIGVYRPSTGAFYLRNSNSAGAADITFFLGNVGDVGIAGDWNGDGVDTTGVFRPSNGIIFLKNTNTTGFADVALNYGLAGDKPVVGDWDNDGDTTIGIFRNGRFYLRNSNTNGFADIIFDLGFPTDMPIAGNWDGLP